MTGEVTRSYRFEPLEACIMCASSEARVLGKRLDHHQGVRPRRQMGISTTIVRCRGCGLIYSNPRVVPETLAQHYERAPDEYWDERQLERDDSSPGVPVTIFNRLWASTGTPKALDVGAGLGHHMALLARQGFDTYGVEPSVSFRDEALRRGVDPDRLQLATVEDAEFPAGSFDLIAFSAVLEHFQQPAAALEKAVKWLAPGGLMFVEVPSAHWLMGRLLNLAYRLQGLDYVTNLSPMHPPYHLYEFTLESFRGHGRRAGYTVAEHQFLPCETFLPRLLAPVAHRVMTATDTGMQLQVWLRATSRPDAAVAQTSERTSSASSGAQR